jgi:hypothetical protein
MYSQLEELDAFARSYYRGRSVLLVPYAYSTVFQNIVVGQSYQQVINIAANADFIAIGCSAYIYTPASSGGTNGPTIFTKSEIGGTILLTDISSGDQFSNTPVWTENFVSNGMGERNFTFPRMIYGRGAIQVALTTNGAMKTADVSIHGVSVRAWDDYQNRPGNGMLARMM